MKKQGRKLTGPTIRKTGRPDNNNRPRCLHLRDKAKEGETNQDTTIIPLAEAGETILFVDVAERTLHIEIPPHLDSVRRALRQAWELDDAAKAEKLIRNFTVHCAQPWE